MLPKLARIVPLFRASFLGALTLALFALLQLSKPCAAAEPDESSPAVKSIDQCLADHILSQELRKAGRLLESQARSNRCAALHCPGQLRLDCLDWVNELNVQIPSVSFRVSVEGQRQANVQVFLDEQLALRQLTGKALKVDPGSHAIRVETPGYSPHTENLIINEGEQFRNITIEFYKPTSPKVPKTIEEQPVTHTAEYVLLGVGVVASANAIGWGIYANSGRNQLESECSPFCREQSVQAVKRRGLVADVALGVGLTSFLGAAIVYWYKPATETPLEVTVLPGGGVLGTVQGRF